MGSLRSERSECSSASALPASSPVSRRRSTPQPPPSRSSASESARSASNTLYGTIGGAWFTTSCVDALVSTGKSLLAELDEGCDQGLVRAAVARGGERAD